MASVYSGTLAEAVCASATNAGAPIREHVHYLENMRAVAIVLVVASHCYGLAWSGTRLNWFSDDPLLSFLSGATPIFVFISGYFFHHVFGARFDYVEFLQKKAVALLPPYVVVTTLLLLTEHALGLAGLRYRIHDPVEQLAMALITGAGGPAMWYIPFIFDMFLLSPLFLIFMRMREHAQLTALSALFLLGLIVDRGDTFARLANIGHFSFYYALGIYCSRHRARFEALVQESWVMAASLGIIVLLAAAQYRAGLEVAAGMPVTWTPEKFVYIRKIALILLLAGLLLRHADRPVPGMTPIARWSFGIFFLHQLPLLLLLPIAGHDRIAPGYGGLACYAALVFGIAVLLVRLARDLFGSRSRYLVGV